MIYLARLRPFILLLAGGAWAPVWGADHPTPQSSPVGHSLQSEISPAALPPPRLDVSGRERVGRASFYANSFSGKTMADGTPMRPHGNNAASRTLPLGTTAMVTNLETGKRAIVTIRDRGPYVNGRIVDLSASTAKKIGLTTKEGVAKVEVAPLEVPLPGATVKAGVSDTEARKDAEAKKNEVRIARLNEGQRAQPCRRYLIDYAACR